MICNGAVDKKVSSSRLMVGHVKSRDGQNGSHHIIASDSESDGGALPEIAPDAII